MQQLKMALTRFVEQQDQYNEAYGLFQNHDLRPRQHPETPDVDKRISLSSELEYLYSHCEMVDAKAEGTLKMKSAAVEIGDAALLFFVAPEHLYRQQLGFRWVGLQEPYEESDSWPPHHIVIANVNDDPVIVDANSPDSDEETYETKPEYLSEVQPKLEALLGEEQTVQLLEYLSL